MDMMLSTMPIKTRRIAVIGMSVWYPGARSLRQFWENIITKRQQFRQMLDCRFPLEDYWSGDKSVPDKTYGRWASYIDDFDFDWRSRRIPKSAVESSDIVHWLTLEVAIGALRDAGYTREQIKGSRTAVILGNTLTGEWTRSNSLRTRWPFVEKVMKKTAHARGLDGQVFEDFLHHAESAFKSVFPPVDEDTLAGGLSNTIAGRVCNYLDVHGGGYTVDGACSSSLLAVINAANALASDDVDMAFAGGVDISLDNFELIGFAKTGALTADEMRVYDQRASGFIPGEGCGFVVLKRFDDAINDGDRIYGVINGWGVSSDGKGGITAPSVKGQAMALRAAYGKAGYDASEIDFVEGHGTGTPLGDGVELRAICEAMQFDPGERSIGVTSLKSVIGHTKAAAGIGAFIKAMIAVNRRVLPPISGTEVPRDVFAGEAKALYPLIDGIQKAPTDVVRAGISAMGFGGINSHVTCESFGAPARHLRPFVNERVLMAHPEDTELFVFGAPSQDSLRKQLDAAREEAAHMARGELADFSASLAQRMAPNSPVRGAFCADSPGSLAQKLEALAAMISKGVREGSFVRDELRGLWLGNNAARLRVAYLFPGQGSQRINMAKTWVRRFDWAAALLEKAEKAVEALGGAEFVTRMIIDNPQVLSEDALTARQRALAATEVAQPAIILASLIWYRRLGELGLAPDVVGGHSLGELMSLYAGGVYDEDTLLELAARRGYEMSPARGDARGTMAALLCGRKVAESLLASVPGYLAIANINGPEQIAVSGEEASIERIIEAAGRQGVNARPLPVSNAFHSKFMDGASERFVAAFPDLAGAVEDCRPLSCMDGKPIQGRVPVGRYLGRQMLSQVDFVSLATSIASEADLVIEVGPGRVLSDLFTSIVGKEGAVALPVEPQVGSMLGFKQVLAAAHVLGHDLNWPALSANRLIRPFVSARDRSFIENPCEREIVVPAAAGSDRRVAAVGTSNAIADVPALARPADPLTAPPGVPLGATSPAPVASVPAPATQPSPSLVPAISTLQHVASVAAELTGFEASSLSGDMKLLDDLNLDSIKAAELIAVLAREFGKQPQEEASKYANATLDDLCAWLGERRVDAGSAPQPHPAPPAPQPIGHTEAVVPAVAVTSPSAPPADVHTLEQRLLALVAQLTQFELETLDADMKLLDDLNMDSIKAAELLTLVVKENGLSEALPLSSYANARISEIARAVAATTTRADPAGTATSSQKAPAAVPSNSMRAQPEPTPFPHRASWVRSFVEMARREDLAVPPAMSNWHGGQVWVIRADDDPRAAECAALLAAHGAAVATSSLSDPRSTAPSSVRDVLIFVPDSGTTVDQPSLTAFFDACHAATHAALTVNGRGPKPGITFVQPYARLPQRGVDDPVCSITAYAASLAQERTDVQVRTIGYSAGAGRDPSLLADAIGREMLHAPSPVPVWFDDAGARWVSTYVVKESRDLCERTQAWTDADVVLASGGARGITAECTFAFAQKTGVAVALVGLSAQVEAEATDAGGEIRGVLDRYAQAGLRCQYYAANVTDPADVARVVERVEQELGPITGLIHGAGLNQPRPITAVSSAAAIEECAPKVLGLVNLLDRLDIARLKMVVGFGSIIGVTGMQGNAVYGFSNEVLANVLAGLRRKAPHAHVATIAYSVWKDVGMGARLGSIEKLSALGIGAIPVSEGVRRFLQLACADADADQVIVAGRMGRSGAWSAPAAVRSSPSAGETLIYHQPQVEAVYRRRLSLATDPYLVDHNFKGSFLFPTVFGLEAMAKAVCAVMGIDRLTAHSIIDISLVRPITVGQRYDTELEIHAEVIERETDEDPVQVRAGVRCDLSGFEQDHFAATFVLRDPGAGPELDVDVTDALPITKAGALYGDVLFQGPVFQRINSIHRLENPEPGKGICVFRSRHDPDGLLLGDPYFRDSLLQSVQVIIPQDVSLPVSIDRIDLFDGWNSGAGERTCVSYLHERTGDFYHSSVVALGRDGRVVERLQGYRLKVLEQRETPPAMREFALA
ncbi:MAG: SDR family NAD(P)-dependent oxidoreductase [Rhodospirillales bacterium]|nr:SDR family NAD(P)-dependent oxidoreductase [Rhodospirillales bacterium]